MRCTEHRTITTGLAIVLMSLATTSYAGLITVGQGVGFDFGSIQSAIDSASSGDFISVAPGVYVEGTASYRGNGFSTGLLLFGDGGARDGISVVGGGSDNTFINFNGAVYGLMFDAISEASVSGFSMWNSTSNAFAGFNLGPDSGNIVEDVVFGAGYIENYYPDAISLDFTQDLTFDGPPKAKVPAPATLALLSLGLAGLGRNCRRAAQVTAQHARPG